MGPPPHPAPLFLQAGLRRVLGKEVRQAGSDITAERTRFDFTFPRKLTDEELKKVEDWVNEAIAKDMKVEYEEMPFEKAIQLGALYSPKEKYPAIVKVYSIRDAGAVEFFSRELCGGPHVNSTGEIGRFALTKQEAVGAGIRRVRGVILSK